MTPRPDTDDEIIAAALLMGAVFTREGKWHRAYHEAAGCSTGLHLTDRGAAEVFLRWSGFHLNFDGQLVKI
jgi:hypothetical protein